MNNETPVEKTRQAITWQLEGLGVQDVESMHESILIRDGLFCGRKFRCEEYQVVWFLDEDEIKFFSPVGELLKTSSAVECNRNYDQSQDRRAA